MSQMSQINKKKGNKGKNRPKKSFILLLLFVVAGGVFLFVPKNFSQAAFDPVEVFFTDISPLNIIEGDVIHGNIEVDVECGSFWGEKNSATPSINFGDGNSNDFEDCVCEDPTTDPLDPPPSKTVICNIHFTHVYNASGTYAVLPTANYSKGSTGGGIGGALPDVHGVYGKPKTIRVSAPPQPGPATTTENPLATSTVSGLVGSISNMVVYIVTGLALLLVLVGGFYIVSSAGNPEQMTAGKKIIMWTIIGYVIIMVARGIVNLILKITGVNVSV